MRCRDKCPSGANTAPFIVIAGVVSLKPPPSHRVFVRLAAFSAIALLFGVWMLPVRSTGFWECERGEGVQGVLTLFCSGAAQVCHDDRVVELKEQLEVEEEDGRETGGKGGSRREMSNQRGCAMDEMEMTCECA